MTTPANLPASPPPTVTAAPAPNPVPAEAPPPHPTPRPVEIETLTAPPHDRPGSSASVPVATPPQVRGPRPARPEHRQENTTPVVPQANPAQTPKQHARSQYDDVYITRFGFEISYIHVLEDHRLDATVGKYHTQTATQDWITQALSEASRLSRSRSAIRIHTTEPDLVEAVRSLRSNSDARYGELKRDLARSGKTVVLARPERETPMWRELMKLMKDGKMLTPSPLVTYLVHTAAITDYERVYCGVVMIGLGSIVVHARQSDGDNLIDAELDMMSWVIENAGGGGRIDVHHSSDGARRIWEQAGHLATLNGPDSNGLSGARLRTLVREAFRMRTTISIALTPNPIMDRFAKAAASTCWVGSNVM